MAAVQTASLPEIEDVVNSEAALVPTAAAQQATAGPDWTKLAGELNVSTPTEAAQRAFEIATYVAEVQRSRSQKLLVKEGGRYFELSLKSLRKGS